MENMYFGSLQNAVNYLFNGYPVRGLLVNNNPWFVARDIANILGYPKSSDMIRSLFPHQVSVISIKDIVFNVYDANTGQINSAHLTRSIIFSETRGNPNVNIISLGGVYALCNITRKNNPIIEQFVKYIDEVILNTLWQRPDLVQEIENYHRELKAAYAMAKAYRDEANSLRNDNRDLIGLTKVLKENLDPDSGLAQFYDIMGPLSDDINEFPQICRKID